MLRKILLITSFCSLAIFFYLKETKHKTLGEERGWEKFTKSSSGVKAEKVKKSDLNDHKLPTSKRAPANVRSNKSSKRDGRYLQGELINPSDPLIFKNRVSAYWKKNLGHNLTRFHPEGTEVLIKKEKAIIHLYQGLAQYREQVLISYKSVDGSKSSYRALIDSSNGKIIFTYDRTIVENFRRGASQGLTHPHFSN